MDNLKNGNINVDNINIKQIRECEKIQNIDLIKEIEEVISKQLQQYNSNHSISGLNK
jgi:hypothetical protein